MGQHFGSPVSIPLRKVSRARHRRGRCLSVSCFHPSKEGFKVYALNTAAIVVPCFHPSKEGFKGSCKRLRSSSSACFHPSKEGFKVCHWLRTPSTSASVSIPLRKVSRGFPPSAPPAAECRFHPSKEGFKVFAWPECEVKTYCFHPSKEGFKAELKVSSKIVRKLVSIPLRKVSRNFTNFLDSILYKCFHPSKEGFKGESFRPDTACRCTFPSL